MNWKVRIKNPVWWAQMVLAVLTPIMAYAGVTAQDITSFATLGNLLASAVANPYVLSLVAVSVWNACNDPTTKGIGDSVRALGYTKPNGGESK